MDEAERLVCALKDAVACAVTMKGPHTIEERAALVDQTTAAVLAAMRKGGVPLGYALVPEVRTPEMLAVLAEPNWAWSDLLRAAKTAAPQPPATDDWWEWCERQHKEVGVTPALRKAYDLYLASQQPALDRDGIIEVCAKVAEQYTTADHAAHDMKTGVFPKHSPFGHAVAAAIRAMKEQK